MVRSGLMASVAACVLCSTGAEAASAAAIAAPVTAAMQDQAASAAPVKETRAQRRARRAAERAARRQREQTARGDVPNPDPTDVVVVGIRGSIATARNRKRRSQQIVDSVVAEDVGKLPDNNVPEALARVPGVQIDRVRGEGSGVTIRGLSDIQTTINGADIGGAGSRSINLSDIPAELLKSVDVYKTRSANQIEGGVAGTVNVELRRPLDLAKGLTLAGSARLSFGDIGDTRSPYYSALAGYRFNTGLGEMGLLVNVSLTENRYNENYVVNESPGKIPGAGDPNAPAYNSAPAGLRDTLIIPYAINYGVERGRVRRPSANVSYQWQPSSRLSFVLEGSYFGSHELGERSRLNVVTNDYNNIIDAVTANPDGTVKTLTIHQSTGGANPQRTVPGGAFTQYLDNRGNQYHTNFETHWTGGIARLDFTAQYDWSDSSGYFTAATLRPRNPTSAVIDFNSPNVPGGGPFVTFPGIDIANPNQVNAFQIHDERFVQTANNFASTLDLTLNTSTDRLLRSFQVGYRYTRDNRDNKFGYRDFFFFNAATQPTLASVAAATGLPLRTTTPAVRAGAGNVPTWINFAPEALFRNFPSIIRYYQANGGDPIGGDFSTDRPSFQDLGSGYQEHEETFAAYAQANFGFKLLVPVDGFVGVRYINTWGNSSSTSNRFQLGADGKILKDANGNPVYNFEQVTSSARGNYADYLPSASLVAHFTPKLQLRLAYTRNVQRPDFYSLRPFLELRDAIASPTGPVYAGNPNLLPIVDRNYSASLEYYFGRAGQLSVAPFLKNQTGFIYYTTQPEFVPEVGRVALVGRPRNAGPGKVAGVEMNATTFFDFLHGWARNFGIAANATFIPESRLELYPRDEAPDVPGVFDSPFTSRWSGNLQLYYDTPKFSTRVAYNYRSKYKTGADYVNPGYSIYTEPTSRLDAAINYTPVKYTTFSVEATNLLRNNANQFYGAYNLLPVGVRVQARTIQVSVRVRR